MFLTTANFIIRPYKIPNQEESKDLAEFIDKTERKILKELLGIALYNEFKTGLEAESPAQKWIDLRDGKIYQINGVAPTYEYVGMVEMLTPIVYAEWLKADFDKHTNIGIVIKSAEHSDLISPSTRISNAYGDYAGKAGHPCALKNSLYGFLKQNESTYDSWVWDPDEFDPAFQMNIWNI